ncbi:hypothetical protein AGOR_G00208230 [Albula goreensis]|uniref:CBF1-interacting co-repressor CIR N-terminal domain-containing protein n=1 Tax=Albula goreensis TaxID=1534307 RepID=A0A8T3CPD8_9TELE|nr:hypothetical protein AGOR_G00208230 [Albula goreensis]
MNILPKKSWHVRNKDNIARVRRDEAQAAEAEREVQRRVERAEQEARTAYLRQKSRAACHAEGLEALEEDQPAAGEKHLNLFPVEEAGEKRGNAEYLKEKKEEKERQERAIGLLVSLGPAPVKDKHKTKKNERRDKGEKRSGESSMERLRAERLQREAEERKRAQALLEQRSGSGKEKSQQRETEERDRPYNSAYFPELARKRQRRDWDQYGL